MQRHQWWGVAAIAMVASFPANAQNSATVTAQSPANTAATTAPEHVTLPHPEAPFAGRIGTTFADSTPSYPRPVTAPADAPNVIVILTDDVGFAAASSFGGPIATPTLDQLAATGLRYARFHTTAMCSPTRAALLTGRNHHAVGNGVVTDVSSGYPGYDGTIPRSAATVAEILRQNGYNTAMVGKHHNVPRGQDDANTGPFDQWPTGLGFEHFYGFIGGDADQWQPRLLRGTSRVDAPAMTTTLDHYLAQDAIQWIHGQVAAAPNKPFFLYFAPGSAHAPHQAPPEWIARFRGQFDQGWDRMREESLARQIAAGIVPAGTQLTPRPDAIPAWSSLSADQRRVYARMMEVYAGMLAYQDDQIGSIIRELERMGERDNTLIIFIQGDNGASSEGALTGSMNELGSLVNGMREDTPWLLSQMAEMGGPRSYQIYPAGWAWAMNTPFQWVKQVGSHLGGTRNGMIVSWPARITNGGGIRTQFTHVNDIMPTILEATGIAMPSAVNGVTQQRVDGVSMAYSFANANAPERHTRQYFEMVGNRAIYDNGWLANTVPGRLPWVIGGSGGLPTDYRWELYDLTSDYSQSRDVAAQHPERLAAMQALWDAEARANNVYPLDDRQGTEGRIGIAAQPRPYVYWGAGISVNQTAAPPLNFRSFRIDADVTTPRSTAQGVLVAVGSMFGGWSFGFDDGRPFVVHAASQKPEDQFRIIGTQRVGAGSHRISYDYTLDGRPGQGGTMTISVDGREVARGRIARTPRVAAGLGETFDIGRDTGVAVTDLRGGTTFNGAISRIEVAPRAPATPAPASATPPAATPPTTP